MECGAKVKSSIIVQTRKVIQKNYGDDILRQILDCLPADVRPHIENSLVTEMIPVEWVGAFMAGVKQVLGPRDPNVLWNVSSEAAKATFGGIYRFFIRLGSPEFVIGKAQSAWSSLCDKGELKAVASGPKQVTLQLVDFPYRNADYCQQRLAPSYQTLLELTGCKVTANRHTKCTARGDAYCEFQIEWT